MATIQTRTEPLMPKRRSLARTLGFLAFALVMSGGPWLEELAAEDLSQPEKDQILVLQRKPFLRKGRVELLPQIGMTVNDSLIKQYRVGGNLAWHIAEPFWVGTHFAWYDLGELGGVTDEYNEVLSKTSSVPDLVEMKWFAGGDVGYVPMYGKFAFFDRLILYYDVSVFAGAGYLTHVTSQTDGQAGTVAGNLGAQQRIFLSDWLALVFEVRDYAFMADLVDGTNFTNIVSVSAGASIFFPFTFEYTTLR